MGHLLALALLALDCLVRAWRVQLATWTSGARLSFGDAFRLNLYGEAASQLTPNRLGGEPARFLGLTEAGLRPVTGLVAIGLEVAGEWPVFLVLAAALIAYYVPDWHIAATAWLRRHRARELVTVELAVAFLQGFAGDFGARQVTMLLLWRFYTAVLLTALGVIALLKSLGLRAAMELFKIGWGGRRRTER